MSATWWNPEGLTAADVTTPEQEWYERKTREAHDQARHEARERGEYVPSLSEDLTMGAIRLTLAVLGVQAEVTSLRPGDYLVSSSQPLDMVVGSLSDEYQTILLDSGDALWLRRRA